MEPIVFRGVRSDVWRALTVTWVGLAIHAHAGADPLWCGTFAVDRPMSHWPMNQSQPQLPQPLPPLPSPGVAVRITNVVVDGVYDARFRLRLETEIEMTACAIASKSASWHVVFRIDPTGAVSDATAPGQPTIPACVTDAFRRATFSRSVLPRTVSARITIQR